MSEVKFDAENTAAASIGSMKPAEAIALGIALCRELEKTPGAYRGGIWPGNISFNGSEAAIGPAAEGGIKEIGPDALEYIAPEQFWDGQLSPAGDVYSVGLVMYAALNGGRLPFFEDKGEISPSDRAAALQKRMRGADLPYPRSACRELGEIIVCAAEFNASDRFVDAAAMRMALENLPESAAIPAVAPVIRLKPREAEAMPSYKVDKSFEKTAPEKPEKPRKREMHVNEDMDAKEFRKPRRRRSPVLPIIILVVIVAVLIILIRGCVNDKKTNDDFPIETETPDTVETSPTPTPDYIPQPLTTPEGYVDPEEPTEPSLTIFMDDVTWEEAKASCEAMGGHLASVSSQEELDTVIAMAEEKGAQFVWLGSYRGDDGLWYNVTGEAMSFSKWDTREPSAYDSDGTPENYLLLWYRPAAGTWSYNDMRNDPISVIPATYSGKMAYICEFD